MKNELQNTHIIPLSIIKQRSIFNCLGFECSKASLTRIPLRHSRISGIVQFKWNSAIFTSTKNDPN